MSTVQNSSERRTIRVKDFLDDFRAGVSDQDLVVKYNLTPAGLDRFYGMLTEKGILDSEEIKAHSEVVPPQEIAADPVGDSSSFICPSCLASHNVMFDVCPKCGVSFQELINREDDNLGAVHEEASNKLGPDSNDPNGDFESFDTFSGASQGKDFNTPEASPNETYFAESAPGEKVSTPFLQAETLNLHRVAYDDNSDEIVPGLPLDAYDGPYSAAPAREAHCDSCNEKMLPAVRDIYDRTRCLQALAGAGICFLVGFFGLAALGWFETYSVGRLFVVWLTAGAMISATVLSAVGSFMYLAKEKVFLCSGCERVYPRN